MDAIKQVGKTLKKTQDESDFTVRRVAEIQPRIERKRQPTSFPTELNQEDEANFWVEFKSEPFNTVLMDMYFFKGLPQGPTELPPSTVHMAAVPFDWNAEAYDPEHVITRGTYKEAILDTPSSMHFTSSSLYLIIDILMDYLFFINDTPYLLGDGFGNDLICSYKLELFRDSETSPFYTWGPFTCTIPFDGQGCSPAPFNPLYQHGFAIWHVSAWSSVSTLRMRLTNMTTGGASDLYGYLQAGGTFILNDIDTD